MNKFKYFIIYSLGILILSSLFSCSDDEPTVTGEFQEGVFVVNEGNFGEGNGSISHFLSGEVKFNVFSNNNDGIPLGDVVQSMTLEGTRGFIVVNNSNKVEVVDYLSMESIATIDDLSLPRYTLVNEGEGYITEWVSFSDPGRVAIFNSEDYSITNTVEVGYGAEYLLLKDEHLYVSNSFENTISVIDLTSESVVKTITVSDSPGHMVEDANGFIWVICGGGSNPDWSPKNNGALVKIDPSSYSVIESLEMNANVSNKMAIGPSGDAIYYSRGNEIYLFETSAQSLPDNPLINNDEILSVYGLGVDMEGVVYIADNKAFQSNGEIFRYSSEGTFIDRFEAGRGPNGFVFLP